MTHDTRTAPIRMIGQYRPIPPPSALRRKVATLVKLRGLREASEAIGFEARTLLRVIAEQPTRGFVLAGIAVRLEELDAVRVA